MLFYCPKCKETIKRDMRLPENKQFMSKRGYKSFCKQTGKMVFLKSLKITPLIK